MRMLLSEDRSWTFAGMGGDRMWNWIKNGTIPWDSTDRVISWVEVADDRAVDGRISSFTYKEV